MPEPRRPEPTPADEETSPARPPRRRRRLWSAITLGAALLTATTVAVTGDDSAPADLPAGWQAWHMRSKGPSVDKEPIGPGGPFNRCIASGASLVCAGDEVMATRFRPGRRQ
ncbi:hypothetical protein WKI71_15475 [Streptomyces sp. MS1.AVA.1]|uniref:Uncharacterized protein n=1 Tax=Streptomyces machairae TaxID=3134109 RepID=A0ABU8UK94_9ACTN